MSLRLPSSSRFGDLFPTISYLRASQGRRAVKVSTVGAHRGADRCDHWGSLKFLIIKFYLLGAASKQKARLGDSRSQLHATKSEPDSILYPSSLLRTLVHSCRVGFGGEVVWRLYVQCCSVHHSEHQVQGRKQITTADYSDPIICHGLRGSGTKSTKFRILPIRVRVEDCSSILVNGRDKDPCCQENSNQCYSPWKLCELGVNCYLHIKKATSKDQTSTTSTS